MPQRKNEVKKLAREIFAQKNEPNESLSWQALLADYLTFIHGKSPRTLIAYQRTIRQYFEWLNALSEPGDYFQPDQFTRIAFQTYMGELDKQGYSTSHRERVKTVINGFSHWLIDERELLIRNPTRGTSVPSEEKLAPRELDADQRRILQELVERAEDLRGEAIFALGYWAGCRVSDVSWLKMENAHIGSKIGWLRIGYKGGKLRDIDLLNEARRPLYDYIRHGGRDQESSFVFTSQRSDHLTEDGIHHWFLSLRQQATQKEWEHIKDITFHDLRHDFAHRARKAGWTLEELAYYLGHTTKRGTPAIQTTVRYTQVGRKQIKDKLLLLKE